jgi:uncharacterized protein (TIGR02246 family)
VTLDRERVEALVDTYAQAWSDPDPGVRREHLATVWADGASYTDPTVHVVGRDALAAHIDGVLAQLPGAQIERTSRVDGYGDVARFAWRLVQADGTALPEGLDFVELTEDGRIARIVGFFGPLE